jgi:uncharacterized membrane protein
MRAVPWRRLGWGLLLLGYALLVHYSNLGKAPPVLGALLALTPLLLLVGALRRLRGAAVLLPLSLLAVALLMGLLWHQIERHFDWIYLCQQCGLYAALSAVFARTLRPGQIPLCTRWATLVHGTLGAETRRYTRAVTLLWTAFFAAVALATLLLYLWAPRSVWSLFVNFLILPAALVLFAAEFLWRRRSLPNARHASLRDMAQLMSRGAALLDAEAGDASSGRAR